MASMKERMRYSFENTLSSGPIAIIGWLAVVSLLIVLIAGTVLYLGGTTYSGDKNWIEGVWDSIMRAIDTGNMAGDGAPGETTGADWFIRGVALTVTIGGIFIVSTLIGTITSGMEGAIEEMRKGRSKVLESNHTLILGWSPKIFTIISELLIANENKRKPRIVIMADRDKVEMEDEIRQKFPDTKNTKVICRTGSPLDLDDLKVSNPHEAKSIIIVSPEDAEQPDVYVIKSILAITNNPERNKTPYHIVAELREEKNMEAGELVGGNEASLILSSDLIARVTAQTCRQSGLSVVYTELMDFDGAEIYFNEETSLIGKTYRQSIDAYEDSAVMGLMRTDGTVLINPPMDTIIQKGDQIIAITEDDESLIPSSKAAPAPDKANIREGQRIPAGKERTLVLGWNEKGPMIISELDNYVGSGSEILIVSNVDSAEEAANELKQSLSKQKLSFYKASITERTILDEIKPESFEQIIILCSNEKPVQEADAEVLITLLHLRNIAEQTNTNLSIVSEMRDVRNRALAEIAKADDFIVSDKLVSLLLSQISENKHLEKVFKDLFRSEGSEIYIREIKDYVQPGKPVDFYTVIEAAAGRGETALGYRIVEHAQNADKAYGVVVNPKKSNKVAYKENDKVIVLAED
jgi:voltage-gated potassium channel Kch